MTEFEGSIGYAYGMVLLIVISAVLLKLWSKSKGNKSVYRNHSSLNDIGVTFLSSLFNSSSPRFIDGRVELRPTWGVRLVSLALSGVVLYYSYAGIYHNHPWTAELPIYAHALVFLLLIYGFISVWFIQRVNYDEQSIRVKGVDIFAQTRDLTDLHTIEKHHNRQVYLLHFNTQKKLNVPSYLSQMNRFVADMETVIERNTKAGK